ncbi:phage tail tape measure protein [Pseudonocardiaceae bacterium YIM PH 21723]|nr:phage tail tape measure protein [Pseudonocardiaceae bacterium YIM PH 21723]
MEKLFIEFDAIISGFEAKSALVVGEIKKVERATGEQMATSERAAKVAGVALVAFGAIAAGVAIKAIGMAGDFQASIVRLSTSAGESTANLKTVSDGVLDMAGKVGISAQDLSTAMYTVESAGYHGAEGLKVLEAASKGARIEGADAKEVADAVSSALNDYHLSADHAAEVTNTLIAAVGRGKTTMQELSSAMPNVMAAAAAAGVSFQEASSALATMTMHGTEAATAGTYLRQVILGLENPTAKARKVMGDLGLDANKVSQNLGKNGLASTIEMVENAINTHLSPAGLVALKSIKKASGGVDEFDKILGNLPATEKTAIGAMADMVGGVKNLQGFLQLGGENLEVFRKNTEAVSEQARKGGKDIEGWSAYQETFNARLDSAKAAFGALMIKIGTDLLPVATQAMGLISQWTGVMERHHGATVAVAAVIGGVLVTAMAVWTVATLKAVSISAAGMIADTVKGAIWLASKIAQYTAAAASAVASAAVSAGAWIAANAAMILATGGIVLAIGLLIMAGVWLYNHWDEVWGAIKRWSSEAWHWIESNLVHPLVQAWHAIGDGVNWLYQNAIKPVWDAISAVIKFAWNNILRPILEVALIAAVLEWRAIMYIAKSVWEAVWGAITAIARAAWDHVIKPVIDAIVGAYVWVRTELEILHAYWDLAWALIGLALHQAYNTYLRPVWQALVEAYVWVRTELEVLHAYWDLAWMLIGRALHNAYNDYIQPVADFIQRSAIHPIGEAIDWLGRAWSSVWDGIVGAVHWAGDQIGNVTGWISRQVHSVLDTIRSMSSAIHNVAGSLGVSLPGFDSGGWVPGAPGEPRLAIVHGGEYVLSADMLAGRVTPDISTSGERGTGRGSAGMPLGTLGAAGGPITVVNVTVQGSVTAERDLAETLRSTLLQMGARNTATYQAYAR